MKKIIFKNKKNDKRLFITMPEKAYSIENGQSSNSTFYSNARVETQLGLSELGFN